MSSDDLQRTIGALVAKVESLTARMGRVEGLLIKGGVFAVAVLVVYLLKQAGLI